MQLKWRRPREQLRRFQNREVTLNKFVHWCIQRCLLLQENGILQSRKVSVNGHWQLGAQSWQIPSPYVLEERSILKGALVVLNMTQSVFCNPATWRQNYCKSETRYETNVLVCHENGILQGNWFKGSWDWACKSSKTSLQAQTAIGRTLITATRICLLHCLDQTAITAKF